MVLHLLGIETVASSSEEEDDDLAAGQEEFLENDVEDVAVEESALRESLEGEQEEVEEAFAEETQEDPEDDAAMQLQLMAALGTAEAAGGQAAGSEASAAVGHTVSSDGEEANGASVVCDGYELDESSDVLDKVEAMEHQAGAMADDVEGGDFMLDTSGTDGDDFVLDAGGIADAMLSPCDELLIKVPANAVEPLVGQDGANIARLGDASGAQLSVVSGSGPTRLISVRGSPEAVGVAQRLVNNFVAELPKGKAEGKGRSGVKGASGDELGICKWFAAGFCRNRAPDGSCRNGSHDGEAALLAERQWVAESPTAGAVKPAKLPVLLLLDLEGGGNQKGRDGEDEIIEVPVLAMCPITGGELGRFHRFARPGFWDHSKTEMHKRYPPDCFNDESSAVPFPEVMQALRSWIGDVVAKPLHALRCEDFLFVTCGNWDVKTIMPKQCNKPLPGSVDMHLQRLLLSRWCNLKEAFRRHYGLTEAAAPTGMRGMLKRLGIPLVGQHHLGMDDVSNLAKILRTLVVRGACLDATGYAQGAPENAKTQPRGGSADPTDSTPALPTTSLDSLLPPTATSGLKRSAGVAFPQEQLQLAEEDALALPVSVDEPSRERSASGILAKYSNTRRAQDAGHDVRVKRRAVGGAPGSGRLVADDPLNSMQHQTTGRGVAKGSGKFGGKCRRLGR